MEEKDLPEVLAIERVSFPNPWHESTFRAEIHNRPISFPYVLVKEGENKVVGYIICWQVGDEMQVNNIAVHPDYRRRGLGETLLRHMIGKAKQQGVNFISLEVRRSNWAAQSLYLKLGFEPLGVRRFYYSNPTEDAIVMGLNLGS